jgi:O-antigen ligase
VAVAILALAGALLLRNVPSLVGRLDIQGTTSFARIHLWRSSLNMFADHPLFGVGLDNFLYQYRGRYILGAAWAEPDLSHPHNVVLDFATRLGILGLLAGGWLFGSLLRNLWSLPAKVPPSWRPVAAGLAGAFTHMLAHGLVDHSFFLVDLAYAFFLMLGVSTWLRLKFVT